MFPYDTLAAHHSGRHAQLVREADAERLARRARAARRTGRAGRRFGGDASEGRVSDERRRFARAA
ncbi:hypothetical protein [Streptomyces thermolilacinus]|uniref:hypothetical protein n=1 Tax=Streptomyces thermolilacinus TaxID=285540 RepID=UPI0033F6BD5F